MSGNVFERKFVVGGISYLFTFENHGCVEFHVLGGSNDKGSYAPHFWNDDASAMCVSDLNLQGSAIPVMRCVHAIMTEMIATKKPYYFYFSASTERKIPIYAWIAKKLAKSLPAYQMIMTGKTVEFIKTK
jgi:hypothetical protein